MAEFWFTRVHLEGRTVKELREILRVRGLVVSGNKSDLVDRILDAQQAMCTLTEQETYGYEPPQVRSGTSDHVFNGRSRLCSTMLNTVPPSREVDVSDIFSYHDHNIQCDNHDIQDMDIDTVHENRIVMGVRRNDCATQTPRCYERPVVQHNHNDPVHNHITTVHHALQLDSSLKPGQDKRAQNSQAYAAQQISQRSSAQAQSEWLVDNVACTSNKLFPELSAPEQTSNYGAHNDWLVPKPKPPVPLRTRELPAQSRSVDNEWLVPNIIDSVHSLRIGNSVRSQSHRTSEDAHWLLPSQQHYEPQTAYHSANLSTHSKSSVWSECTNQTRMGVAPQPNIHTQISSHIPCHQPSVDMSALTGPQSHHELIEPHTSCHKSCCHQVSTSNSMRSLEHRELVEALKAPDVKPPMFSGDRMEYPRWKKAFHAFMQQRIRPSASDKLYYLEQYTSGDVRDMIKSYLFLESEQAFECAIAEIDNIYGDSFLIAQDFKEKLASWGKISNSDYTGIRKLTNFLRQCQSAMKEVDDLQCLNLPEKNQDIVRLLPDYIAIRWNDKVVTYRRAHGKFPPFSMFVDFMSLESQKANDPVTSQAALKRVKGNQSSTGSSSIDSGGGKQHRIQQAVTHHTTAANHTPQPAKLKRTCPYCNSSDHVYVAKCSRFKALDVADRIKEVTNRDLCVRCMNVNHGIGTCNKDWKCSKCQSSQHHSLLHQESKPPANAVCNALHHPADIAIFAPTVPVWISSASNPEREILTYAVIDSQSNKTFMTDELARSLCLEGVRGSLEISTMTSTRQEVKCNVVSSLRVRGFYSAAQYNLPPTYTRSHIPHRSEDIPYREAVRDVSHLEAVIDLIPPNLSCSVGLLLGRDCTKATRITKVLDPPDGGAQAVEYALGWTVVGPSQQTSDDFVLSDQIGYSHTTLSLPSVLPTQNTTTVSFSTHVKDISPMELMRQIDSVDFEDRKTGSLESSSQEDILFMNILDNSIRQDHNNYYTMPLPFRCEGKELLSSNYEPVLKRFQGLMTQFQRRGQEFQMKYQEYMNGIIARGEAEPVPLSSLKRGEAWYLPHHGVFHPRTKKLRVVFDCSSSYKGVSLNDTLLQGPDLNNSLLNVLMGFRLRPVAVSCDIEKMFLRFRVVEEHRDYMRFLWLDEHGDIQTYRMCVHIFGARSSPNCAKYGLNKLAQEHGEGFPAARAFIQNEFYVDDGLSSVYTTDEAISLLKNTQAICAKGNLRVHKILSNKPEVLDAFPQDASVDIHSSTIQLLDSTERALGMLWSLTSDSFTYNYNPPANQLTRRGVLANVASLYDPMGFIAPLVLPARLILQDVCKSGQSWDDLISGKDREGWLKWDQEMAHISNLKIPRCIIPDKFQVTRRELHTFVDASERAYGCCTYVRSFSDDQRVHCALVIGKSKVAPVKHTTIPRLELQAAVLGARQNHSVLKRLEAGTDAPSDSYLWSDSQIVLGYISNSSKRFHTYIANRVSQIQDMTNLSQWHYVRTDRNPADIASRGMTTVDDLNNSSWFSGPKFLWDLNTDLESQAAIKHNIVDPDDPEIKKQAVVNDTVCRLGSMQTIIRDVADKLSSWSKMKSVVAMLQRVTAQRSFRGAGNVSLNDCEKAGYLIIRTMQGVYFSKERQLLDNSEPLDKSSSLRRLDCYVDDQGIIRVGGRLKNARSLHPDEINPIVLPKNTNLSLQIIRHFHDIAHLGRHSTMSAVRSAGFWIVGLSTMVSSYIHRCVDCRRLRRPCEGQKMADLPADRVEVGPAFTNVGCDVFGPFPVTEGRKTFKKYALLFTCLASRAVHIEVLDDLSTDSFIQSWRCFVAIRGNVKFLRCDNGTNFVGANNLLDQLLERMDESKIKSFLRKNKCEVVFNPPTASHMGGAWERMIKTIRSVFSGMTIHMHRLNTTSLRTIFYECMSIVNSRPLTTVSEECKPLSPNDLLHLKSSVVVPLPGSFDESDSYSRKRWRAVQYLVNLFWTRWRKEYIHALQQRQRWNVVKRNLKVGDVVMLSENSYVRTEWPVGRIIETMTSADKLVRTVKVVTFDLLGTRREYVRPVSKLVCLIENN